MRYIIKGWELKKSVSKKLLDLKGESPLAGTFVVKTIHRKRNFLSFWRGAWFCPVSCLESSLVSYQTLSIDCFFLFETLRRFERKFSTLHQMLNDSPGIPRCSRDCSGGVCVCVCVCVSSKTAFPLYLKSCTTRRSLRGAPGIAPVSWWWHHSRRRRDCSRVLSVCI